MNDQILAQLSYNPETGILSRNGKALRSRPTRYHRTIKLDGVSYQQHRVAFRLMTGRWPTTDIDHINRIKCDNRWVNLREVSRSLNKCNTPLQANNTSGVSGVVWKKSIGKWNAVLKINGKSRSQGCFVDWFEAVCARKSAESKSHVEIW